MTTPDPDLAPPTELSDPGVYRNRDLADMAEPLGWVVEGLVAEGCQLIVAGSPKRGKKSILCMYLAKCVSRGLPFLGFPTRRRPVIFVALEGGRKRMARRWQQLGLGSDRDRDATDLDAAAGLTLFGMTGYERALDTLRHQEALVIVDPLVRVTAHRGINENDPTEVTRFLYEHEELLGAGPGASLLWIHHFRKSRDAMRGSTAYEAATDGWWENYPTDDPNILRIEVTSRDGPDLVVGARFVVEADGAFAFERAEPMRRRDATRGVPARPDGANGLKYSSDIDRVREALCEVGGAKVEVIAKAAHISRPRTTAALGKLVELGDASYGAYGRHEPTEQLRALLAKRAQIVGQAPTVGAEPL